MRTLKVLWLILFCGLMVSQAFPQILMQDNFSALPISTANWNITSASGGSYTITAGELHWNTTLQTDNWNQWSLVSDQAFSRVPGTMLRVTFDLRVSKAYSCIVGFTTSNASATAARDGMKYAFWTSPESLYLGIWNNFSERTSSPTAGNITPGGGLENATFGLRLSIYPDRGAKFEFRLPGQSVFQSPVEAAGDQPNIGDNSSSYYLAILNARPFLSPPTDVYVDNVVVDRIPMAGPTPTPAPVAAGPGFTYQGKLKNASGPVNGNMDLQFRLWDFVLGGSQKGSIQTIPNVPVTDGLFSVVLNAGGEFGQRAFDGNERWLEISLRPAGSGAYTTLSPRQKITGAPFATVVNNVPEVINVKDYGALGNGSADDTVAIQKAINAANPTSPAIGHKQIFFPHGDYKISSLNITNRQSIRLQGASFLGSRLVCTAQTTPRPVIDASGSPYFEMQNLSLWGREPGTGYAPNVFPTVGVLLAGTAANAASSTKCQLSQCFITGFFSKAACYIYSSTNNSFMDTSFHNYANGAPAFVLTGSNSIGGSANYVTSPYVALPSGTQYTSDASLFQCEVHSLILRTGAPGGYDPNFPRLPNTHAIVVENASGLRFYGGVIGSDGSSSVDLRGSVHQIQLDGAHLESETGTAPTNSIFVAGSTIFGLALRNVIVNNGVANLTTSGIVAGSSGTVINGLTIEGNIDSQYPLPNAKMVYIANHPNPATRVINNSIICAGGRGLYIGGSIGGSVITNPGPITQPGGATNTALVSN